MKEMKKVLDSIFGKSKWNWYDELFFRLQEQDEYRTSLELTKKHAEESRLFFENNWERVCHNIELLADKRSKKIYEGMIKFRMSGDDKYHPGCEKFQYFPTDIIELKEDEVFVDCGGYTADTTLEFASRSKEKYKRIILFEPDPLLEEIIKRNTAALHDFVYIPQGVYDTSEKLTFLADGSSGGTIVDDINYNSDGVVEISVVALDEVSECSDASFIKMDLEGSEWNALHGAEKIIKDNHPKLAICLYHSNDDMIRIIEYIHSLVPEYKLYVRQHKKEFRETVLYAIC